MKHLICLSALFFTILFNACKKDPAGPDNPQPPPSVHESRLATMLDSLRYVHDLPALAGAVVSDTGAIDARAVGCRRWGGEANVTDNDRFHLGSETKAMTAALIGMLVDDGLTGWDSTLLSVFPEYEVTMRSGYRAVTMHEILTHSAGFVTDTDLRPAAGSLPEQRNEVVAWALAQQPANDRGTYNYSNVGYIIAGAVADKLTARSYEELLSERLLEPLGITTAGFGPMGTPGLEDQPLQHTADYDPLDPGLHADNPPVYNSAGRLHMSIGDWSRFIAWVLACEAGNPVLVSAETADVLTTGVVPMPGEGRYACGWAVVQRSWANGKTLTHSGSNTLNYAVAWLAPDRKFAVIAATNIYTNPTPAAMDNIVSGLIVSYLDGL
ncbi:beta-lactamase family protein [bacterium]|nr:beta-lactamase family protein [bacterium]